MARNISADDGPVNFSTDVGRSFRLAALFILMNKSELLIAEKRSDLVGSA